MADTHGLARWLDPEMQAFVARSNSFYPDEANGAGIADSRRLYALLCEGFRAKRPPGVTVTDAALRASWGAVPVRRYQPAQARGSAAVLYLHGGGFMLGGLDSHDDVCAELCAGAALPVWAVAYRLAPEHVYPAALDDAEIAYRALRDHQAVVVGGDSAGGHLAASLCHRLRRLGEAQPRGQLLIYPGLSSDPLRVAGSREATAPMLSAADCSHYRDLHAGGAGRVPHGDPEFAPLDAHDFAGLAPAAILAAGYDPLRQDAEDYAAALNAAGVAVAYRCDPSLVHGWLRARHASRRAARSFAAIVEAAAALADGTPPDW